MNYDEFANSESGQLVATIDRQMAFVPNPLPPKIDMQSIAVALGDAMQAIGELKGACRRLQNPYMLVNPLQRREALTSSAMEGTHTSADKLAILEAADGIATDESTREVYNYINALREALKSLPKIPICHRLIKEAHFRLLRGLGDNRGAQKRPGEYKNTQNWIGALHIQEARFIPPPALETQACMDDLERYINRENRDDLPFLIEAALVHYQFEAIHPFADGNGRLGRMLISLMMVERGLLESPVMYVSPFMETHKDEYIDRMYDVSAKGAWSEWIAFFLTAIQVSSKETIETIDALINLQNEYREKAANAGRSSNLVSLVDSLFESPVLTIPQAATKLGVTYVAAQKTVERLVDIGILEELASDLRPKYFLAPQVIQITIPG